MSIFESTETSKNQINQHPKSHNNTNENFYTNQLQNTTTEIAYLTSVDEINKKQNMSYEKNKKREVDYPATNEQSPALFSTSIEKQNSRKVVKTSNRIISLPPREIPKESDYIVIQKKKQTNSQDSELTSIMSMEEGRSIEDVHF